MRIAKDPESREDDTGRDFVNEKPLHPDGPHMSGHQAPVLFWVWPLGGAGRGREGCGWGRREAPGPAPLEPLREASLGTLLPQAHPWK